MFSILFNYYLAFKVALECELGMNFLATGFVVELAIDPGALKSEDLESWNLFGLGDIMSSSCSSFLAASECGALSSLASTFPLSVLEVEPSPGAPTDRADGPTLV